MGRIEEGPLAQMEMGDGLFPGINYRMYGSSA